MATNRRQYLTDYQRDTLRKKKKRVELLLDPSDHQILSLSARGHRERLSPFIIKAALAYLDKTYLPPAEDDVRQLELHLRRIGTNINQLAKKGNREGISTASLKTAASKVRELEALITDALRDPSDLLSLIRIKLKDEPSFRRQLKELIAEATE